jgi:hypothetical protein
MRCNLLVLAAAAVLLPALAKAQEFHAKFSGFEEVGALNAETGAIFSNGQATLKLKLNQLLEPNADPLDDPRRSGRILLRYVRVDSQ